MTVSHRLRRRFSRRMAQTAAVSAATFALAGGALALAPTASAVGQSGCDSAFYYFDGHINMGGVNLRSGPGTSYSSKGLLSKGTGATWICSNSRESWKYVKIKSGAHANTYGWVYGKYWDLD